MKQYLLYAVSVLLLVIQGCQKETNSKQEPDEIAKAKAFFEEQVLSAITVSSTIQDNPRKELSRVPEWNKAHKIIFSNKTAVLIPLKYNNFSLIKSNMTETLYSLADVVKLLIYKDAADKYHAELLTFLPDKSYQPGSRFTGIVFVDDWSGKSLRKYKYETGVNVKVSSATISMNPNPFIETQDEKPDGILVCYEYSGYTYVAGHEDEAYYWTESGGCDYIETDQLPNGIDIDAASDYDNIPDQGGTGGAPGPASTVLIPGGNNPIIDFNEYTRCFTFNQTSSYQVTVCVDQPVAGTRQTWGISLSGGLNPVNVGHTFLILTEFTGGQSITRNVGFFPSGMVSPFSPTSQGQLNNDASHEYDISVTISLSAGQFANILQFISHGNDQGNMFNLNSNNCTTFTLNALAAAGLTMPSTIGYWPGGSGNNPGDFGEDLRSMDKSACVFWDTLNNPHPNEGSCN